MSTPIDMPPKTPADAGDEHTAENGISYTWDGAKWVTTLTAEERAERLWVRDGVNTTIFPVYLGDDVEVRNASGVTTGTFDGDGNLTAENILNNELDPLPA